MNSSPTPIKRTPLVHNLALKLREKFSTLDGDSSSSDSEYVPEEKSKIYGTSPSNNSLLCNFEESALNGRLQPVSTIDGFKIQLGEFFFINSNGVLVLKPGRIDVFLNK